MAVCTFLGHKDIYDKYIHHNLLHSVYKIARENNEIEFLFMNEGDFYFQCLAAVLDVKQHCPQKHITITLVVSADAQENLITHLKQGDAQIPACIIDNVIAPPPCCVPKNKRDTALIQKKLERWAIQQSTHVISYLYFAFFETENRLYKYAQNKGAAILNITSPVTASYIMEYVRTLSKPEQYIITKLLKGQTQKEIGEDLNISPSAVRNTLNRTSRILKQYMTARLQHILTQTPLPPIVCSIFALGSATGETLALFEQAVLFLLENFHVTQFYVASEYCHTRYMEVLTRLSESAPDRDIQIVAITHYPELSKDDWKSAAAAFCPPCHAVKNIDTHTERIRTKVLRMTKAMIEQSDFCICNLSNNTFAKSITVHMSKIKGTKVFDISKKYAGT